MLLLGRTAVLDDKDNTFPTKQQHTGTLSLPFPSPHPPSSNTCHSCAVSYTAIHKPTPSINEAHTAPANYYTRLSLPRTASTHRAAACRHAPRHSQTNSHLYRGVAPPPPPAVTVRHCPTGSQLFFIQYLAPKAQLPTPSPRGTILRRVCQCAAAGDHASTVQRVGICHQQQHADTPSLWHMP